MGTVAYTMASMCIDQSKEKVHQNIKYTDLVHAVGEVHRSFVSATTEHMVPSRVDIISCLSK